MLRRWTGRSRQAAVVNVLTGTRVVRPNIRTQRAGVDAGSVGPCDY